MQKEIKKSDLEELFSDSEKIAIKVYNLKSRTVESLIWSDVLKLKFFSINNYRIDRLVSFFSIFIAFSIFHRIFALENLEYYGYLVQSLQVFFIPFFLTLSSLSIIKPGRRLRNFRIKKNLGRLFNYLGSIEEIVNFTEVVMYNRGKPMSECSKNNLRNSLSNYYQNKVIDDYIMNSLGEALQEELNAMFVKENSVNLEAEINDSIVERKN